MREMIHHCVKTTPPGRKFALRGVIFFQAYIDGANDFFLSHKR